MITPSHRLLRFILVAMIPPRISDDVASKPQRNAFVIEAGYNYGFDNLLENDTASRPGQIFINLGFRL
jgi:hypothetical protein